MSHHSSHCFKHGFSYNINIDKGINNIIIIFIKTVTIVIKTTTTTTTTTIIIISTVLWIIDAFH